ncbi:MAG: hypothetical protein MJ060_05500, partial [Clostridia bacterium]|nr:hypothetical protein [Clostridia bacterium]
AAAKAAGVPQYAQAKTYTVDSYLGVGTYPTIDLVKDSNGNMVPYIGYYSNACSDSYAAARMAYPVNFTNHIVSGSGADNNEKFTGNWEITVIPTEESPISDRINVGLRKSVDTATYGTALAIPTGKDTKLTGETNDDPVSATTTIYGNGTTNPGVCFAVDKGFIQFAQKK